MNTPVVPDMLYVCFAYMWADPKDRDPTRPFEMVSLAVPSDAFLGVYRTMWERFGSQGEQEVLSRLMSSLMVPLSLAMSVATGDDRKETYLAAYCINGPLERSFFTFANNTLVTHDDMVMRALSAERIPLYHLVSIPVEPSRLH